jgi:hypothetical protein
MAATAVVEAQEPEGQLTRQAPIPESFPKEKAKEMRAGFAVEKNFPHFRWTQKRRNSSE